MQVKRIQIVFHLLVLAGCAGIGQPLPESGPEMALRKDRALKGERGKAASPAGNGDADEAAAAATDSDNAVYFAANGAEIGARGQALLRRHALRLKDNPRDVVTLIGYNDPLGSRSYNLALTEERLDSVAETLRSLGVARGQIRRASAGRTTLASAGCDTSACRQLMRRVELVYER